MPLAGVQLTYKWALALCYYAGFRGRNLTTAVALMCAESGRYVGAYHDNYDDAGNLVSVDRGLFQINSYWHADLSDADAYKAIPNAAYAFGLSSGENFAQWAAFTSEAYKKFLPAVHAARVLGTWRLRVSKVETELGADATGAEPAA